MSNAAIGFVDLVTAATLSADGSASGLGPERAKTDLRDEIWRGTTTTNYLQADLGATQQVGFVGAINTNLISTSTFRVRVSANSDMSAPTHDSTAIGTGAYLYTPRRQLGYVITGGASGRYVRLDMTVAAGVPEVGRLLVNKLFTPTHNFAHGATWGAIDPSQVDETDSGSILAQRRTIRRFLQFEWPAFTNGEDPDAHELMMTVGGSRPLVFVLDPASPALGRDFIWGRCDPPPSLELTRFNIRRIPMRIVE